jgi:hypothetical protein
MATNLKVVELETARVSRDVTESVRRALSGVSKPSDRFLRNAKGDAFSRPDRSSPLRVDAMVGLLFDAFQKGRPESELQQVPAALSHAIRSWYKTKGIPDFDTAHVDEEKAESEADVAEAEFRRNPNCLTLKRLVETRRAHDVMADMQVLAATATVYGGDAA